MANQQPPDHRDDHVQLGLDYINDKLAHPSFLKTISPSRLPSQAASEETSPAYNATFLQPGVKENTGHSPLRNDSLNPDGANAAIDATTELGIEDTTWSLSIVDDEVEAVFPYKEPVTALEQIRSLRSFVKYFNTALLLPNISSEYSSRARARSVSKSSDMAGATTTNAAAAAAAAVSQTSFQTFDHGHQDLVLAVDFDFYGTRMVTASSDHRLKVWDKEDDHWAVTDTWRAHDAEIVDVKFNGPFTTPSLASIAEDSRLHIWAEDVLQPKNSAHRFRRINTLNSETTIPFCSLAFKSLMSETYLATITRDGYLAVYEPVDSDDLSTEWGRIHGEHVCATPDRSQETGFAVDWHKESVPCWTAVEAGLDRKSMGLAVAAMDVVKIFRTDRDKKFHQVAELTGARKIVRDIGWANGSMRGYDLIATASKDGVVRVYEISTPKPRSGSDTGTSKATSTGSGGVPTILEPDSNGDSNGKQPISPGRPPQRASRSALSSNLARAGTSSAVSAVSEQSSPPKHNMPTIPPAPGMVRHTVKCVAEVGREHGGVWRLAWSFAGDLLITTGDDGSVRAWKRTVHGEWKEAASLEVEGG